MVCGKIRITLFLQATGSFVGNPEWMENSNLSTVKGVYNMYQ